MTLPRRRAALAIGVSDAPPLPFLGGAATGAREFHEWAQRFGYESRLVTDESEPITAPRLRREFEAVLSTNGPGVHRFIIYFAGHGVIREVEEGLWLLSDWNREMRAVAVEVLKRRLRMYRVNQVAIFADACRTLPADIDTADLTPDALLGKGPGPRSVTMPVDKFIAAQDGTQAFMIPGKDPGDDRCLFSGAVLSALWGTQQEAFSKLLPGKVTSRSLGTYLQTEVPRLAETYKLTLVPSVSPSFPENDDIYYGDGPPVDAPIFPPWPRPGSLRIGGAELMRDGKAPEDASGDSLEGRMRTQDRPQAFETGSGFAVDGESVVGVWTAEDVYAEAAGRPDWWRVRTRMQSWLERPSPALIQLANGLLVAVTALPGFIGSVVVRENGAAALVYRHVYADPSQAEATEAAIGALERGGLRASDALDLAAELRIDKHLDPVRGVLSAYLYDSIADVESVRRMAYAYIVHAQPIPYDIALLADLKARLDDHGLLRATVPSVPARPPHTQRESKFPWTHSATPEAVGTVGGFWPLLRQGWAFLDDDPGSALVLPGLDELAAYLSPARFTTFNYAAGLRLAGMFRLTDLNHRGNA